MKEKHKLLYVDDEEMNTLLFEMNFSDLYEVHTASCGFEALNFLNEQPNIPIIISDMKMPKINGIEFIKKAKEKYPTKKYFILTGFDIIPVIQESLDNGLILKCFRKPFNKEEIETEIEKCMNTNS